MSEPIPKAKRRWWKYLLLALAGGLVVLIAAAIYVTTDSFQALVRRRLVAEIERITGGRAHVASIHTIPFRLQAEVRDITVHGYEAADDVPLAHADGIVARFKIVSLLRSELAFDHVVLERPVVHVDFYSDGSTNIPGRRASAMRPGSVIERLLALSINHFEVRHGQVIWGDQSIPLDLDARDTSLQMDYSFLGRRYDGRLLLGQVETKLPDCRPFAWMTTLEFALSSNSALISSLQWNSGHSHISATGQVSDFRHPYFQGPYGARLDLTEVASIARRPDLRGGVIELKGRGEWSADKFSSIGFLSLQNLSFQNDQIAFSRATLTAGYSATDQDLQISKMQGRVFGGSFDGQADFNHWLSPPQRLSATAKKSLETATISAARPRKATGTTKSKAPAFQNASITLRLRDLSANEVAIGVDTAAHPFPHFRPAAAVSAVLEGGWKGTPRDAEIRFSADVLPSPQLARDELPIDAHTNGTYYAASDSLEIPHFALATPTSRVSASGTLSSDSALRLSVATSSLADWLPFISAVRGPALFPVALNGTANFTGSMHGSIWSPQISGNLQANDFDITIPSNPRTPQLKLRWDSLSTALQVSFDSLALHNAKLSRLGTTGELEGSASLQHGHLTADSAFNLSSKIYNADLATLKAIAHFKYPVEGKADLTLQASGTIGSPHGSGEIHLTGGSVFGESIHQFDSQFHFFSGELAFENARLLHEDSVITGNAAYETNGRGFRFDIAGKNLDLSDVDQIASNYPRLAAAADFNLKGSGTLDLPALDGAVHLHHLSLDRELIGDLDLNASTQNHQLHLTGNSNFPQGSLTLTGTVQMGRDYPATLSLKIDGVGLDPVLHPYVGNLLAAHSLAGGSIDMSGPLRCPDRWTATGTLAALSFDVQNLKISNQEPVRFSLANETLSVQQLHLAGDGTDFTARGTLQLSGARNIDLVANGRADLKLLSTLDPNFTAAGMVTADLTVAGTMSDPFPQGRMQISGSSLGYAGVPSGLTDLTGSLLFTRDHFHIDQLSARTGGGTVDLKGDATYAGRQLNFNLAATAKDVRMRYPLGVSSIADAQLQWVGSPASSTLSGDIAINKIAITPGFDFSAYIDRSRQLANVTVANSPLNNMKLDVHVRTAPELQMRTAVARLSGDADLRIRGSLGHPAVLGRADILEGQATFHGTRFTLEHGDITFANPVAIEPQLNLQASTHVRDYDLSLTITGTPDRGLSINYRSEPPLPQSDIVALLALGRANEQTATQLQEQTTTNPFSDQATAQILSEALNTTVGNRFQRLFGASNIKIDPQGLTTETNPISNGPQITIEQQFVNHISLVYSTNVSQTSEQIIQGEYYVNRNVSAVGTRDQNGVVSFDLRARSRKK